MATNKSFKSSYKQLNKQQKSAVDTIDGPVMVVAGPGTGKTQVIALRIANILASTDADPDSILALTFTESGARAMRERLVSLIGHAAYYVNISTFHSFCTSVIKDNPDFFTLDPSTEPLSELEKLKLIHQLLDQNKLKLLKPVGSPHHYTRAILATISDLKREGVSPQEFATALDQEDTTLSSQQDELSKTEHSRRSRSLIKNRDLLIIYRDYQQLLQESSLFDFEDMINSVTDAFTTHPEDLLRSYQERFHYFLADEYQDTNSAQNELLLLLTSFWGQEANLFVVGDPDQSIFRFQGASIENQLTFIKHFPKAQVITLQQNYRSTQTILDAADSLITHNNLRINDVVKGVDSHLTSQSGPGKKLRLAKLANHTAELIFLAEDIKSKLKSGVSAKDIAVIYRTNAESASVANTFIKYNLDYSITGGANILEDSDIANFLRLLRVIDEMHRRSDDEDLFTILHYDIFAIAPLDVLKLARLAGSKKLTLFDVLADDQLLSSLDLETKPQLTDTLSLLAKFSKLDANHTFTQTFETILHDSGYLNWLLNKKDSHHRISRFNTMFDEVKRMNRADHQLNLRGFLANLELMQANNLRIEESAYGRNHDAITLTTAHSAKGLEWEHVYLTRAADKQWGNNLTRNLISLPPQLLLTTNLDNKEKNEDERRLFYVALTRGKQSVTLTYANEYTSFGTTRSAIPSMFLAELGDSHLQPIDTTDLNSRAHTHLTKLLTPASPKTTQKERAFLQELADNFALSPTSLNAYLQCPYKFKLDKLLRLPHSKKPHLAFGTAVHSALESFYREYKDSSLIPPKDFLLQSFQTALDKEVLTKDDHTTRLEQGRDVLSTYYDFFVDDFREPLFLEKFFRVKLADLTLTGKVDRIEWLDPGDRTVRVVDYKTGKGKTKGQIEGTTKNSDGDLKRQLIFYRLLLELDRRLSNITFGEAELDFVQVPSDKQKSGRHNLRITPEEVADLKKTIHSVMSDIHALKFPRTDNYQHCAICDFRAHCWPEGIPSQ